MGVQGLHLRAFVAMVLCKRITEAKDKEPESARNGHENQSLTALFSYFKLHNKFVSPGCRFRNGLMCGWTAGSVAGGVDGWQFGWEWSMQ